MKLDNKAAKSWRRWETGNMAAAVPQNSACGHWWALSNGSHEFNPHCVPVYLAVMHSCVTATGAWPSTLGLMSLFHTNFRAIFFSAQQRFSFSSLPFLVLHSLHDSLKTYYNNAFCFVLFFSLLWFHHLNSSVLSRGLLRSAMKNFKAEAMKIWKLDAPL